MSLLDVFPKIRTIPEASSTHPARKGTFPGVRSVVIFQVLTPVELLPTNNADELATFGTIGDRLDT